MLQFWVFALLNPFHDHSDCFLSNSKIFDSFASVSDIHQWTLGAHQTPSPKRPVRAQNRKPDPGRHQTLPFCNFASWHEGYDSKKRKKAVLIQNRIWNTAGSYAYPIIYFIGLLSAHILECFQNNAYAQFVAGFRIRIRIGSGFNRASGSGFGIRIRIRIRRAKMTHKSRKFF